MLMPGDVLVKKEKYGKKVESTLIATVQAVAWAGASLSSRKKADPTKMHIAMYVGKGQVVEETGKGLDKRGFTADKYIVFRWSSADGLAKKAAENMEGWTTNLKMKKVYGGHPIRGSSPAFIPQLFGNSWYGPGAKRRRRRHRKGSHGTMICSEAVIVAYQLAADELPSLKGNPIILDSKLTSPMRLAAYLSKDTRWKKQGELIKTPNGKYVLNHSEDVYKELLDSALSLIHT